MSVGGTEQNVREDRDRIFPLDNPLHERELIQEIAPLDRQFHRDFPPPKREKSLSHLTVFVGAIKNREHRKKSIKTGLKCMSVLRIILAVLHTRCRRREFVFKCGNRGGGKLSLSTRPSTVGLEKGV